MKASFTSLLAFCLLATQVSATQYTEYAKLPTNVKYDYVIVGGGLAGSVLANRLSEDSSKQVLLLEAGGDNVGVEPVEVPLMVTQIPLTYMWNYTTVAQPGLNGNSIFYPRGYLLGGSTNINGMFYTRGSSEDFDRYAKVTGDPGWSYKALRKYFDKSEKWVLPADGHDISNEYDPKYHSLKGGMHAVSLQGWTDAIKDRVLAAGREIGAPFTYNKDINSGNPLGLGILQTTIDGDHRSSAAVAYLTPDVRARRNLHILLNARASRVLPTPGKKAFRGVEFAVGDLNGPLYKVEAKKEVILSAGAIGTPQVLLNSGIGEDAYLKSLGIPTLHNLPSVGRNLSDQPTTAHMYSVNSTDTYDTLFRTQTLWQAAQDQRKSNGTGPLVNTPCGQLAFWRLPDSFIRKHKVQDPTAGRISPHLELVFANGWVAPSEAGNFLTMSVNLVNPIARGSVKLDRSGNSWFNYPLIDPAFYDNEFDIKAQVEGIKASIRFAETKAFEGYTIASTVGLSSQSSDADVEKFIRDTSQTSAHPVGSASMSAKGASYGVTDPDLLVKGVQGLRVVDASVFPFSPSAHTQSVVYVFAERAADLIKSRNLQSRTVHNQYQARGH